MTKFALLSAVALVCVAAATPVKAQEVIYNPGYCAQFYPNANCQNKGPNNPYTGDYQRRLEMRNALVVGTGPARWAWSPLSAAAAAASIATDGLLNRAPAGDAPWRSFVRNAHFLDHPPVFGQLIARHRAQLFR